MFYIIVVVVVVHLNKLWKRKSAIKPDPMVRDARWIWGVPEPSLALQNASCLG
jgi:hypothetical protein